MLAAVSFPIYVRALVNAFIGREQKWHVTGSTTAAASPFNFMIPQVLAFVVPAAHLGGRRVAGPGDRAAHAGHGVERHQHPDPRRLHRGRLPRGVAIRHPRAGRATGLGRPGATGAP